MTQGGAPAIDHWFQQEVLPLSPAITGVIRRSIRNQSEVHDLRQEVYLRIYERAVREIPRNTRAFVFTVLRNLLIDRARRAKVELVEPAVDWERLECAADDVPVDRQVIDRHELDRLRCAIELLPPRCREVVVLRRISGLSQRQTAARMSITEDTVERQMRNGLRRLAELLAEDGMAVGGCVAKTEAMMLVQR